jgi:17 kDa outer membrane surface antigen
MAACISTEAGTVPPENLRFGNVRITTRFLRTPTLHDGLHQIIARAAIWTRMPRRASASARRLTGLMILLAGCGSRQPAEQAGPPAAPVPEYGVGDSYRFSDGATQSVIAIDRDTVRWRGSTGTYVTSHDVLLPTLAWTDASAQGERRIATTSPLLFPLQPGKGVAFAATRTVRSPADSAAVTVRENWRCDVSGTARLETAAGVFDTWRVDCSMTEQPVAPGGSVLQRSFYYAPEIGFYVRREERTGDSPVRQVELVDYTAAEPALPESALRLRVARIQQALERDLSGDAMSWNDPATGVAGEVRPVRTARSRQYGWCRDFAEHIRSAGRAYSLQGTGCRNASGIWDIVELGPARNGAS